MHPSQKTPDSQTIGQLLLRHSPDAALITDADGHMLWLNEAFEDLCGFTIDDVRGQRPRDWWVAEDNDLKTRAAISNAAKECVRTHIELRVRRKAADPIWVELRFTPIFDETGRHIYRLSIARDISRRKAMEAENRAILEREMHRNAERKVFAQLSEWLYASRSMEELTQVIARGLAELMPETDGALYFYTGDRTGLDRAAGWGAEIPAPALAPDECWSLRRSRAHSHIAGKISFPCHHVDDPEAVYYCLPVIAHGEATGLLHIQFPQARISGEARLDPKAFHAIRFEQALIYAEQISLAVSNVMLREQLIDQSLRDPLTGLANRRKFHTASEQAFRAAAKGGEVSLITLDIDHFKRFNDEFGHDAGDLVLAEVSRLLAHHIEGHGEFFRMGGEEFTALCPGLDRGGARAVAERVCHAVARLRLCANAADLPPVTVSTGIATFPGNGQNAREVLAAADQALFAAKADGRNRVAEPTEPGVIAFDRIRPD